jgi:hypothetical protein
MENQKHSFMVFFDEFTLLFSLQLIQPKNLKDKLESGVKRIDNLKKKRCRDKTSDNVL